jgi:hypothetical protein
MRMLNVECTGSRRSTHRRTSEFFIYISIAFYCSVADPDPGSGAFFTWDQKNYILFYDFCGYKKW